MFNNNLNKNSVVFNDGIAGYPRFPYYPDKPIPELNVEYRVNEKNMVYDSVRNILIGMGLDSDNVGTNLWNPFGALVKPGGTVLIKPNWVRDYNVNRKAGADCLLTHSSVIRPLIDYSAKALGYTGKIIIGDAPLQNCDFEKLKAITLIEDLISSINKEYPNVKILIEDWRLTVTERQKFLGGTGRRVNRVKGDRYRVVDLGDESFLGDLDDYADDFRVTCYDYRLMLNHHSRNKHQYLVTENIFEADLILNVPVLKTHIKAGITCSLKNLVGINGHKEYLPHHCKGGFKNGGDNYYSDSFLKRIVEEVDEWYWIDPNRFNRLTRSVFGKSIHFGWKIASAISGDSITGGGWSGNDTIWRTIIDLNHILACYDPNSGQMHGQPIRNVIHIVDAVICGEGEGPLAPDHRHAGYVIGGWNPALVDLFCAKLIGYNVSRIKSIACALYDVRSRFKIDENSGVKFLKSSNDRGTHRVVEKIESLSFVLPKEWQRCGANRKK